MKKSATRLLTVASVVAMGIALAGCSSTSGDGGDAATDDIVIGFVPGATQAQFWTAMKDGAEAKAEELGVTLEWQGAPDYSVAAQTPILNSMAALDLDALIVAPVDGEAMFAPINAIAEAGTKIVTIDSGLVDTSIVQAQVVSDNAQGGAAAAEQYVAQAGTTGTVAILGLTPEAVTVNARLQGFVDKMGEIAPDVVILPTQYGDGDAATQDVFQSVLVSQPDLTGVFVPNSAGAGAAAAVKAQGREGIVVIGYDSSEAQVALLKSGEISGLILQQPGEEGAIAVQAAYDLIKGETPEAKTLVPNILATTENAEDADISPYFY